MLPPTPNHFFFYGTLIPQFAPPGLQGVLAGFRLVGEGWLCGELYDLGNYPGAVFDRESEAKVFGRVFQAADETSVLEELDRYEGYDPASTTNQYVRQCYSVTLDNGDLVECWVYEYNGSTSGRPIIRSGRWRGGGTANR